MLKVAQSIRQEPIKLFASPWNAPAWMKSNHEVNGKGYLLPKYYSAWANYFIKFLNEYKKQDIEFWGLTAQNEPWDGTVPDFTFNAMGWNASTQREWIVEHLGPALEAAGYSGKGTFCFFFFCFVCFVCFVFVVFVVYFVCFLFC